MACCSEAMSFLFSIYEALNVSSNNDFFKSEPSIFDSELAIFVFFQTWDYEPVIHNIKHLLEGSGTILVELKDSIFNLKIDSFMQFILN